MAKRDGSMVRSSARSDKRETRKGLLAARASFSLCSRSRAGSELGVIVHTRQAAKYHGLALATSRWPSRDGSSHSARRVAACSSRVSYMYWKHLILQCGQFSPKKKTDNTHDTTSRTRLVSDVREPAAGRGDGRPDPSLERCVQAVLVKEEPSSPAAPGKDTRNTIPVPPVPGPVPAPHAVPW
jgi:hypothetical protein